MCSKLYQYISVLSVTEKRVSAILESENFLNIIEKILFQILDDRTSNTASSWRRDGRARSRSGSHERRRRGRRSRSKSRDRNGRRRRSRSPRDRKESERDREKKREREKKGLPPVKRNCLSGKKRITVKPESTHHRVKYHCIACRQFDWIGIDQTRKYVVICM